MNANDLKYLIAIYKYDRTENAAGTPIEGFLFYKYTYASMKVITGELSTDSAPGTVVSATVEFIVRHDPVIDYRSKIVDGANSYFITYIEEITRKGFLKLICRVFNEDHVQ